VTLPLRELQSRLAALISDPATLTRPDAELATAVEPLGIRGDARLSAVERVRVYGRMYFLRLRDALANDLPALHLALGANAFGEVVQRYVAVHPSDRPSLRDLGRHLPGFLHGRPDVALPWHAELAQLEWAMIEAFDARDEAVLTTGQLATLTADAWPELPIRPVGSLVLLACTTPVDDLRERLLAGEIVAAGGGDPVLLRVWRQDRQVFLRRTSEREMAALRWLHAGSTFGELCGWLAEHDPDGAAAEAMSLLGRWLDDALLAAP